MASPTPLQSSQYVFDGSKDDKHRVVYFDLEGKGQSIRYALAHARLNFVDERYSREDFEKMKDSLTFGQLPLLVTPTGDRLFQTAAILRYIGRVSGDNSRLYPSDPVAAAHVDALVDFEKDLFGGVSVANYPFRFGFDHLQDNKELTLAVRGSIQDRVLPRLLGKLENILQDGHSWLAGTEHPTIADFAVVPRLKVLTETDGISSNILEAFPKVTQLYQKFYALEAVVDYNEKNDAEKKSRV